MHTIVLAFFRGRVVVKCTCGRLPQAVKTTEKEARELFSAHVMAEELLDLAASFNTRRLL